VSSIAVLPSIAGHRRLQSILYSASLSTKALRSRIVRTFAIAAAYEQGTRFFCAKRLLSVLWPCVSGPVSCGPSPFQTPPSISDRPLSAGAGGQVKDGWLSCCAVGRCRRRGWWSRGCGASRSRRFAHVPRESEILGKDCLRGEESTEVRWSAQTRGRSRLSTCHSMRQTRGRNRHSTGDTQNITDWEVGEYA
jgi:hypothetical protein